MEEGLREFREKVQKKREKGKFRITNSIGVYNIYRMLRKNKWPGIGKPVTSHDFYIIVRRMNQLLVDKLLEGNPLTFPFNLGVLELRKCSVKPHINKKGKLIIPYPIDWEKTTRLWYEDPEAMRDKVKIRMEVPELFQIKYNRYKAKYNNKAFYHFVVHKPIKKRLKENIITGKIDALW